MLRDEPEDSIDILPLDSQEVAATPITTPQKKDDAFITPTSF
jgi:hypothetical protein